MVLASPMTARLDTGPAVRRGTPQETDESVLEFGEHEIDFLRRELRYRGRPVDLQRTPLRVLLYLAEHRDRTVPKRELMDAIWQDAVVGDASLARALAQVRSALRDDGETQRVVCTQKGVGYRFVADIRVAMESPPVEGLRFAAGHRWVVPLAAAALAVGLAASSFRELAPGVPSTRRLAVLPLEILTGDPREDFLADAMTDALIAELARLGEVRVVPRHSVTSLKREPAPLADIASELNADVILEGTILREGRRTLFTLQLIDARSERHLWVESFERTSTSALDTQREVARVVAREVARALAPRVAPEKVTAPPERGALGRP